MTGPSPVRIDKWLWHARFCKTRTMATRLVASGRVRLNRERVTKPHRTVVPGDVLTFPHRREIRVVRVVGIGSRRGPAAEAAGLYEDVAPCATAQAARC